MTSTSGGPPGSTALARPATAPERSRRLPAAGEAPLGLRLWAAIDRLRSLVNASIRACLPGERGEIATALITMRNSGLFHILSISGLHW